ncbi:MAG: ferrochelatase [Oleiphilaceae bacterium]|nr:ferrochelatase [Oleiphilaceae bacterium]
MAYKGNTTFSHRQADKVGVLLTNLGTPDAPNAAALRRYLSEFLSDPRVVEIPRLLWLIILHGIILRVRPKRSAEAYASVWTNEGSPLLINTRRQTEAVAERLAARYGEGIAVDFAMRYGQPAMAQVIDRMLEEGVRRVLVLPLYPQYSGSTTGSTFDALSKDFTQRRWLPHLQFVASYHDEPAYIAALAESVRQHWEQHGRADKLVLSYHGVPRRYLDQGDPYHCQCHVTTRLLANALGLEAGSYMTTFQSRFGKAEWLKPYTDQTLKALPEQGIKSVQVICPGFSSDCLETLEEIAVENRDYFIEAGGERFEYIPALNADKGHIDALEQIIERHLAVWPINGEPQEARQQRYQTMQGAQ